MCFQKGTSKPKSESAIKDKIDLSSVVSIDKRVPDKLTKALDQDRVARVCMNIEYKVTKKGFLKSKEKLKKIEILLAKGVSRGDEVSITDERCRDDWLAALQQLVEQQKQESDTQSHGSRVSEKAINVGMQVEARFGGKDDWSTATVRKKHAGKGGTTAYDLKYADGRSVSEFAEGLLCANDSIYSHNTATMFQTTCEKWKYKFVPQIWSQTDILCVCLR